MHDIGVALPVVRIGWPDEFIDHGKPDQLMAKHGLTVESALERVEPHLKNIKPAQKGQVAVA
jgi:1-deoxy-D-xylulose-5-phosphate synthase